MIDIRDVTFFAGRSQILHAMSLSIPRGGVTALIGPNGAGKSTLLALMARLLVPASGRVEIDGLDVARTSTRILARKLSILRQDAAIATRLTVRDLVGFGRYPHNLGRPGPGDAEVIAEALAEFDLDLLADRFLDELSGGQRQRALVAMTFAQETDYLLLDEPLNNLDLVFASDLMRKLRGLADQRGRTVVVVLHDINHAAAWADRVVALRGGQLVAQGSPDELIAPSPLRDIFGVGIEVTRVRGRPFALHQFV